MREFVEILSSLYLVFWGIGVCVCWSLSYGVFVVIGAKAELWVLRLSWSLSIWLIFPNWSNFAQPIPNPNYCPLPQWQTTPLVHNCLQPAHVLLLNAYLGFPRIRTFAWTDWTALNDVIDAFPQLWVCVSIEIRKQGLRIVGGRPCIRCFWYGSNICYIVKYGGWSLILKL